MSRSTVDPTPYPVHRRSSRLVVAAIAIVVLAAACAGAGAATTTPSVPAAPPASGATVVSSQPSSKVAPSPSPVETPGPPADLSAWTARQGFGGSSGLNALSKATAFVVERASEETLFYLDDDAKLADGLARWLDLHPATACWADYHDTIRAGLARISDGYAAARPVVAGGGVFPGDIASRMDADAHQLAALPAPDACP